MRVRAISFETLEENKMAFALFDKIHDEACFCKRTTPATMEEFVEFGLQPEDYVHYVGLQFRLQGELLAYGCFINDTSHPAFKELISFCKEKHLIECNDQLDDYICNDLTLRRSDAGYYHGWLRYPKDPSEFRLAVELKLSSWWDEEAAYACETLGDISFEYDEYAEAANGALWADPESPFRVKKYDPATKGFTILKSSEVQKMYETVQREMREIEHKIAAHLAEMPTAQDASSVSDGLPWIKTLYELCDRKDIIEDVLENLGKAASTPDIYKFKESDTLTVFGDEDTCREAGHLLKKITVDFSFYGKANKQFTIQRCSHCKQFRISLSDLLHMFESYGVPRGKIAYENDTAGDFSGFADASVFYNMGYTVSQSVGLHASERQSILKCAIDAGKASKYEVMSFLKRRMNINGMKAGNELAFQKWKEDLEYIRSL